jgi:hypothetical protein
MKKIDEFVAACKPDGAWARLFARQMAISAQSCCAQTDSDQAATFVTIDRWKTTEDFTRFQEHFGAEYRLLDTQLEGLTLRERKLETFISED